MDDFAVRAERITKRFDQAVAVGDLSLDVHRGEFLSFLGPSGCGKTTTLRMIAGFVEPDAGTIVVMGEDMTDRPPHLRNLGMVFQSYALFPHMTAYDNVAFGLKMRKVSSSELKRRVLAALDLVQLSAMQHRYPRQLSGGQQQRVALARAIVIEPYVLLLDEPLSNLDAKLRKAMQTELRDLQQRLGITAIYVTHDQEEAMTVSDRIVVMNRGQIMQVGSPTEVYRKPANEFVAGFIGQVNFIAGRLESSAKGMTFIGNPGLVIPIPDEAIHAAARGSGVAVELAIRPEAIAIEPRGHAVTSAEALHGLVTRAVYTGASTTYHILLDGGQSIQAVEQDRPEVRRWDEGDLVTVVLTPRALYIVPATEQ